MENVFTGDFCDAVISAETIEESIPPDSNTPSGTSDIIHSSTEILASLSISSTASSRVPVKVSDGHQMQFTADQ